MEEQSRPRSQLTPALSALMLFIGGAWVASQGGLFSSDAEAANKFFGAWAQFVRSLPILLSMWIGAIGLGAPIRMWLAPKSQHWLIIQAASGWGVMLMLGWLLAWFGLLNGWTAWGLCGLGLAVWTYHFGDPEQRNRWHPDNWPSPPWTLLLGLPALGLLFVVCACPPGTLWSMEAFGYDVTSYHLQVPREWLGHGQMVSLHHNVYSHLPLFNEVGYMQVGAMHGSIYGGIYTTQFLHASMALFAAVAIAKLVSNFVGRAAGVFGGVVLLVLPWTVITGSLAYNEMFVLAFGAAALLLVFDENTQSKGGAAMLGFLLGCATLSKLTAGAMIGLPIGLMLLMRFKQSRTNGEADSSSNTSPETPESPGTQAASSPAHQAKPITFIGMTVLAGVLTLAPYLLRNTIWSGNPVFPFATSTLGLGHWDQANADRWNAGHGGRTIVDGVSDLPRQWLLNTGYGAVIGQDIDGKEATDIARFQTEFGVPLFWLLAFIGAGVGLAAKQTRPFCIAMLLMLGVQLLFWLLATHHQSRFLLPTLLPGCVLVGIAFGRLNVLAADRVDSRVSSLIAVVVVFVLTNSTFKVLQQETLSYMDAESRSRVQLPVWQAIDSLIEPGDVTLNQPGRFVGHHPLNDRIKPHPLLDKVAPVGATLMMTHDGRLLYVHRAMGYNTPFDDSLIGELLERYDGDVMAVSVALLKNGVTHVWINYPELRRLAASYGLHERLTPEKIKELTSRWAVAGAYANQQRILFDIRKIGVQIKPNSDSGDVTPPVTTPSVDKDPSTKSHSKD